MCNCKLNLKHGVCECGETLYMHRDKIVPSRDIDHFYDWVLLPNGYWCKTKSLIQCGRNYEAPFSYYDYNEAMKQGKLNDNEFIVVIKEGIVEWFATGTELWAPMRKKESPLYTPERKVNWGKIHPKCYDV